MPTNTTMLNQVEGPWEELIRHPDQFAGRRVRVTVLSDDQNSSASLLDEIRRWLAEGDSLDFSRPILAKPDAFGDALTDKFRRQGLVI
jgi:hypothetical protein